MVAFIAAAATAMLPSGPLAWEAAPQPTPQWDLLGQPAGGAAYALGVAQNSMPRHAAAESFFITITPS
jgi:hypothetical protein